MGVEIRIASDLTHKREEKANWFCVMSSFGLFFFSFFFGCLWLENWFQVVCRIVYRGVRPFHHHHHKLFYSLMLFLSLFLYHSFGWFFILLEKQLKLATILPIHLCSVDDGSAAKEWDRFSQLTFACWLLLLLAATIRHKAKVSGFNRSNCKIKSRYLFFGWSMLVCFTQQMHIQRMK